MWVGEEGRILGSVTIGGCVDARVIAESEQALSSFKSRLVEMKLGNEDAWEIGFSCAGDLDVFIDPVDLTRSDNVFELYRAVRNAVDHGKRAVLATSLNDSSRKLLLIESGEISGSLGTSELDREAQTVALELNSHATSLRQRAPLERIRVRPHPSPHPDDRWRSGKPSLRHRWSSCAG